jgi:hypothetical protein
MRTFEPFDGPPPEGLQAQAALQPSVAEWLAAAKLPEHAAAFAEHGVTAAMLPRPA